MSELKRGVDGVHPKQRGMIMATLIVVLLANLLIQIWLLYTALNNALDGNKQVAYTTFFVSLVLFLVSVVWLFLLPKNVK